jgi:diketogulonate reductase-like aldo/keto reductase
VNIPTKKLKNGFVMPVLGIGTWYMGGGFLPDSSNDEQDIKALKTAIDLGITHIDTAELYGNGHSEELIGKAIKGYDRAKLFITSKVFRDHLKYEDVLKSFNKSLKRLGTSYLDLYLIHAPNEGIQLKETIKALDELKEKGLTREIGVSNFSVDQLKEAQSFTKNRIVINQIHYNLAYQDLQDVVDYCQQNDVFITAYRPVERGVLTRPGIKVLDEMCDKYKKTPAQIALNWLISQDNILTISKTSTVDHLKENLGALNWQMKKNDIEKLRNEFPDVELPQTVVRFNK